MPKDKVVALITACGRGNRFDRGDGIPKQYQPLGGLPILRHSINAFLNHKEIDDVICVIHPDDIDLYEEAVLGIDLLNPAYGSDTRQASIRIGLEALKEFNPTKVLIHDAVRPFVSKRLINGILEKLETHPAVIPAIAVEDTIKQIADGKIEWTLERDNLWRAQTPQGFIFEDILNSHNAFQHLNFTDDSAINEYAGIPVAIVPGSQNNFKITTVEDYERAERMSTFLIPEIKEESRSGIGYDVHAFSDKDVSKGNTIRVGGVNIPFSKKVVAHSDGDVLVHAIVDALLGAVCLGDIGDHFSNQDNQWKNANSMDMLKIVSDMIKKKNAKINNIDTIVICEEPKMSKYKSKIQSEIAKALNINDSQVNVKATTTERMGFLGRKEGIAAKAIAHIWIQKTAI